MVDQNIDYEESRLGVYKIDAIDTVTETDEYLKTLMSSESGFCQYLSLIMKIFYNIFIGGSAVMLEFCYLSIELIFMANLADSKILLPANTIAKIWLFSFSVGIFQFNSGQTILVSRYQAKNDYQGIKRVIKLHTNCLIGCYTFWLSFEIIVFNIIQFIYPNNEELIKWTKINILLSFMLLFLTTITDFYRNLYIALGKRAVTFVFSFVTLACMVTFGWLLGFYCGYGFWGVELAFLISEVVWVLEYLIYLYFSKSFESYRKNIKKDSSLDETFHPQTQKENQLVTDEKDHELCAMITPDENIPEKNKPEVREIQTYKGYIKYNIFFGLKGIFMSSSMNGSRLIMSKYFMLNIFTAWSGLDILYFLVAGFGYGICNIIASDFSKLIVSQDIPKTKRYAQLSTIIVSVFTASIFTIVYVNRVFVAKALVNDIDVYPYIEQQLLSFIFFSFAWILMMTLYGIVKGLGKEKKFVLMILFCFILVQFPSALLMINLGFGPNSVPCAQAFSAVCVLVGGFFIIGIADWKKEAAAILSTIE